jgi:hypothetical protein
LRGINDKGYILGQYVANADWGSFVRAPGGKITKFDVPGSTLTWVFGINNDKQTVGVWQDAAGIFRAFLRDPDGTIIPFDVNGSSTGAGCVNDSGAISGTYAATKYYQGFIRDPDGVITTFDIPGVKREDIVGACINAAGVVAGYYFAHRQYGRTYGYIRTP